MVRRVLATHYRPDPGGSGPSWLTFLGHAKDSLWSIDLFRCESAILRSHWVLVVMDQYTRRIVGFGIHAGIVDGPALCRMFNHAIRGLSRPTRLSSDNDPLYRFHQWHANLRVLPRPLLLGRRFSVAVRKGRWTIGPDLSLAFNRSVQRFPIGSLAIR